MSTPSSTWKSTRNVNRIICFTICRHVGFSGQSLSWCHFTSATIWERISPGKYYECVIEPKAESHLFQFFADSLKQSLQWPFREMIATVMYDFNPTEPNQLPLRVGTDIIVIGKEGDNKGWWRGKSQDRVRILFTSTIYHCGVVLTHTSSLIRSASFPKSMCKSRLRVQMSYDRRPMPLATA